MHEYIRTSETWETFSKMCLVLSAIACGLELCAVGFGSFVYHSNSTAVTGFLDLGMMFVLLLFYVFYGALFFVNVHFHWIPLNIYRLAMVAASIALGSYVSCSFFHDFMFFTEIDTARRRGTSAGS